VQKTTAAQLRPACAQVVPDQQLYLHHALHNRRLLRRRHVGDAVPLCRTAVACTRQRQALVSPAPVDVHVHSRPRGDAGRAPASACRQPLSTGGQTSLSSRAWASRQGACAARPHAVPDGGLDARSHPVRPRASQHLCTASQAVNTLCYVAANTIILFGHCLWYAPSVLWLGFIRWEVRLTRVIGQLPYVQIFHLQVCPRVCICVKRCSAFCSAWPSYSSCSGSKDTIQRHTKSRKVRQSIHLYIH